jgi:hypothetical protein
MCGAPKEGSLDYPSNVTSDGGDMLAKNASKVGVPTKNPSVLA